MAHELWNKFGDELYVKSSARKFDKAKVCREFGIDIMIEDDPKNIDMLKEITNVLIFDTLYNRLDKYKDVTRAYSWYDVYMKINSLNNKF